MLSIKQRLNNLITLLLFFKSRVCYNHKLHIFQNNVRIFMLTVIFYADDVCIYITESIIFYSNFRWDSKRKFIFNSAGLNFAFNKLNKDQLPLLSSGKSTLIFYSSKSTSTMLQKYFVRGKSHTVKFLLKYKSSFNSNNTLKVPKENVLI